MFNSFYDGFYYKTNDPVYNSSIIEGKCEPYPKQLVVVKRYCSEYPDRCRTMVDIGGCIGTTALPYSRLYSKVYAFEPNPESFSFLQENIQQNNCNNITAFNLALSDRHYKGISERYGNNSGMVIFRENAVGSVESSTLDDQNIENVDFIKIDTEGTEYLVLKGAEQTLRNYKPLVQLEVNGCAERLFGIDSKQIYDFMTSLGYRYYDRSDECNPFYYVSHESA